MRPSGRKQDELRAVSLEAGFSKYAEGSCLARFGDTHVLCTASIENSVPIWMKNSGKGWITAEYGMLPRSTGTRTAREASRGKQSGRTLEIQRLIGRSLRAVTDMAGFGELQIRLDCDVIQADGGTRTAAITGSYVALQEAFAHLKRLGVIAKSPMTTQVAAVSCGVFSGEPVLDLDYAEDSAADADANFVLTTDDRLVEVQATAEERPFSQSQFDEMLGLARHGTERLFALQREALGE